MPDMKPFMVHADWEYELTDEQMLALKAFVEKLNEEDRRAYFVYKEMKKQAEQMLAAKNIDDYYIDTKLNCFSDCPTLNQKYDVEEEGDPIVEHLDYLFFDDEQDQFDNWNEYRFVPQSPFYGLHFSYSAHCLFFHGNLRFANPMSFHDMLSVNEVGIDVKVNYQFCCKTLK